MTRRSLRGLPRTLDNLGWVGVGATACPGHRWYALLSLLAFLVAGSLRWWGVPDKTGGEFSAS